MTTRSIPPAVQAQLGHLGRRFGASDGAERVIGPEFDDQRLGVVTGFGPTNAPTAGTLSVMLGVVELQQQFPCRTDVVISELGAWNSRNVPWPVLEEVRDQMMAFMVAVGFDESRGHLRSHLDTSNLLRAGKIARFLSRQDFLEHREDLLELYDDHGLLGSEVGLMVDGLYTVADILGPAEASADRILVVCGEEEAYFTNLARLVMDRQARSGDITLGWRSEIGALYFRVLEGLNGYPKMSKSIPASSIHLGMPESELVAKITSDDPEDQPALLGAIELSSGWEAARIAEARLAYKADDRSSWGDVKREYAEAFVQFSRIWTSCAGTRPGHTHRGRCP